MCAIEQWFGFVLGYRNYGKLGMEGFKLNAFQPWHLILEIIKQLPSLNWILMVRHNQLTQSHRPKEMLILNECWFDRMYHSINRSVAVGVGVHQENLE